MGVFFPQGFLPHVCVGASAHFFSLFISLLLGHYLMQGSVLLPSAELVSHLKQGSVGEDSVEHS